MESNITSEIMLVVPWPLLVVGLLLGIRADHHARLQRRLTALAAWFALTGALLAVGRFLMGDHQSTTFFSVALPKSLGALAINTDVNAFTLIMLLLVAFVGVIVSRYSSVYMEGDEHEGRFHRWLGLTLGSFFTLIVVGNIWAFLVSWIVTSLCLHKLLAFYDDRPGAVLAARKKYLLHRIADASLFGAFVLIAQTLGHAQFASIGQALSAMKGPLPETLQIASGLIVLSAILKSAQIPFHGWLIQVMEAPTPVSALLHAGIIYTGTFLLLRMSPIISRTDWAMDTLVLVGLFSIAAASLMMMVETNIKESLAYSTCAQMGFMLMECGLGLYSIAVMHIVAHSLYKAHAFLASGSVVDHFRSPALPSVFQAVGVWKILMGMGVAVLITIGIGHAFGVNFPQQPALIALGGILVVAMTQLMLQSFNSHAGVSGLLLRTGALSALVGTSYFGLHWVFAELLGASLPSASLPEGSFENGLLALIVIVFLGLLLIQQRLPVIFGSPFWKAVYIHLYNGLYVDMLLARMLQRPHQAGSGRITLGSENIQSRGVKS